MLGLGVGVLLAVGGLSALPALASASSSCTYDPATKQVTVTHDAPAGQALTLKRSYLGYIYINDGVGRDCQSPAGAVATVRSTDKITVRAATPAAFQHTVIDESSGGFEPGATRNEGGYWLDEIDFVVLTGSGGDHLTVRDENFGYGRMELRTSPTLSLGPQIDLNGDGDYDLNMTQAGLVTVFGGSDPDYIYGSDVSSFSLELRGGGGDDYLAGGRRYDALYGESGNDTLYAKDGATDNAFDDVDGGPDYDSARVDPVDWTVNVEHLY
jgi:Ca2+-binding RTX toxin-like protein